MDLLSSFSENCVTLLSSKNPDTAVLQPTTKLTWQPLLKAFLLKSSGSKFSPVP
jgi:hypothetical protein